MKYLSTTSRSEHGVWAVMERLCKALHNRSVGLQTPRWIALKDQRGHLNKNLRLDQDITRES